MEKVIFPVPSVLLIKIGWQEKLVKANHIYHLCFNTGRIMSSLRDQKTCEDRNGTDVRPQEESQPKVSHISQFLPTSRRIVQFSNGKVFWFLV